MSKKAFYILIFWVIIACLSVFLFTPSLYSPENPLPEQISHTNKIILDNENSIEKINGVWCSTENDFYPVNNELVDNLLIQLQQSSIYASNHRSINPDNLKITLEDITKKKLDLFLSSESKDIVAHYNKKYYSFPSEIKFPSQPYQWFTQPLFDIQDNSIISIKGVNKEDFSFAKLTFLQATKENYFSDWVQKEISIKTEDGITLLLTLYTQNHSYWLSVKLGTTIMPTIDAKDHLKNNQFLYDGWFFEIPQHVGNELFSN